MPGSAGQCIPPPHCTLCGGTLAIQDPESICAEGHRFPTLMGIPDLRVAVETWIDFEEDRRLATELAEHYVSESFEELVARVWRKRSHVPDEILKRRLRGIYQAQEKYRADLSSGGWLINDLNDAAQVRCLEIGCGTGGFLEPATEIFGAVAGIDVSLAWLITAKKRLEQAGKQALLVCACVERLPWPDNVFDAITCFDVIEHVDSPEQMLRETWRASRAGGKIFCTTPNRFSLTAEPHVGVWGVGLLPRRWMAQYVAWRNGMSYLHTRLLSLRDIRELFRHFRTRVQAPLLWQGDIETFSPAKQSAAEIYNRIANVKLANKALLPVAPFFQVVARKETS